MITRSIRIAVLVAAGLACVAPARADWISCIVDGTKEFCRSVARDTKRRNCWPEPFTRPDRYAVRAPFALMVSNGWRRQNLLGEHHFVDQGGKLTEAGRLKIRWILTEAPQHHRTIYVHRATKPEVTAARIDDVQQLAAQIVPEGALPLVLETSIPAGGWPAARADIIGRKFESSAPDPRLPESSSGGGESE
ncbi:MAG: hypothetical protein ACYSWU_15785 [Planctomycetota bacterium]|jgi:hypothetical protein